MIGTVVRVFLNKGYGFVRGEDGMMRFLHVRGMKKAIDFEMLHEGKAVIFTPTDDGTSANKLRAVDVELSHEDTSV
jgi:cold shock CspA family protein